MATNAKIKNDIQQLDIGSDLIDLFEIDATDLGGGISYLTPMTDGDGGNIDFNGNTYIALPMQVEGMEILGDGKLPRPTLSISNISLAFIGLINTYQDGIGAKVTRLRTFKKYLDGAAGADPSAEFPRDVFYIEQKIVQTKNVIQWELVAPIDIGNQMIPRHQALPYCQHRYRIYDSGFDYTLATCPYTGTDYFNGAGEAVTIAADSCGRKLSDCELRYSAADDQLPFKGFPVVGQISQGYR